MRSDLPYRLPDVPEPGVRVHGSYAPSYGLHQAARGSLYDAFVDLSLGYKSVPWYNFKRFGNLSLRSLYAYQHDLIMLDKTAFGDIDSDSPYEPLSGDDLKFLRTQLKEYRK